jgi:hypothetical protein
MLFRMNFIIPRPPMNFQYKFNIKESLSLVGALITVLCFSGCGSNGNSNEAPIKPESIATNPIYIKEFTTGIKYKKSKLSKLLISDLGEGEAMFKFNYFGQERTLLIKADKSNTIYELKIDGIKLWEKTSLISALEEKLSDIEGKKIEFDCRDSHKDTSIGKFDESICTIISGTQKLILEESLITVRNNEDSPIKTVTLILVDDTASKQALDVKEKENIKEYEQKQTKAKQDI